VISEANDPGLTLSEAIFQDTGLADSERSKCPGSCSRAVKMPAVNPAKILLLCTLKSYPDGECDGLQTAVCREVQNKQVVKKVFGTL